MTPEELTRMGGRAGDVFRGYAHFCDQLYADKDYAGESRFVERVLASEGVKRGGTVLDLGCGTGDT